MTTPIEDAVDRSDTAADEVIAKHVGYAMLGGAIPVPLVDLTAVAAVQLDMLKQLAKAYDAEFDPRSSRAFISAVGGAMGGNLAARLGSSLLKTVPVVGWLGGAVSAVVANGASTWVVGRMAKKWLRGKRALRDVATADVEDEVAALREEGREFAASMHEDRRK